MKPKNSFATGIRWTARIAGSLMVAFTLFFGIAEMIDSFNRHGGASPFSSFNAIMILMFLFWFFALAALVLALWKEGWGGFISLACFGIMYILTMINPLTPNKERLIFIFLIFCVPSLLYIYYWWITKEPSGKSESTAPEAHS